MTEGLLCWTCKGRHDPLFPSFLLREPCLLGGMFPDSSHMWGGGSSWKGGQAPAWNADEKSKVKQASWAMRWPRGKGENVREPWAPTSSS